ncbi:rhomboid family intramembrane serine protease [Streptacidiphilus sp. N1-12]|uniref:Rhomboid family intramembrane serine protease n=2 Tax=Streptacidiphilus alkalitolerans TaxID=3342712 RepID=A0ABV6XCV8_9ACTN
MVIPVRTVGDNGPAPYVPVVTWALIALCTLVFLVGPVSGLDPLYGGGSARACSELAYYQHWGVIPHELLDNRALPAAPADGCPAADPFPKVPALSVLTAMFVHGGWLHLLGNMVFLYVFGAMVEERMGRLRYLLAYLGLGYLATYGYALFAEHGDNGTQTLVGASGAIAGVLGAYLCLYPRARVTSLLPFLLFLPLRFPAWVVLGVWFGIQWASVGAPSAAVTGVAYTAHLIGFAGGFLFAWLLYCRSRGYPGRTKPRLLPGEPP